MSKLLVHGGFCWTAVSFKKVPLDIHLIAISSETAFKQGYLTAGNLMYDQRTCPAKIFDCTERVI